MALTTNLVKPSSSRKSCIRPLLHRHGKESKAQSWRAKEKLTKAGMDLW